MNKKLLITICFLLFTSYAANAQSPSWQWGKRGGSSSSGSGGVDETVVDMATDPHGNVYVLSKVYQTGLNVDGHSVTDWGSRDVLISSFKCDGTYRWSKDIGTSNSDLPVAIKTDTLGGVYVTGDIAVGYTNYHVDADSTWMNTHYKTLFLVKYDTGGNYKWFRMPQPDTVSLFGPGNTGALDMDVDPGGNVYLLCVLDPGAYAGGSFVVTATGIFMLKYDRNGNFISGNPMSIAYGGGHSAALHLKRDHVNGRHYITIDNLYGSTLTFGSTSITHNMTIGCFSNSGTLLWTRQDTDPPAYGSSFGRPAVDANHNIYLGGRSSSMDTFNTYAVINGGSTALPVAYKLDTNGTNIWAKNATVTATTFCSTIILNGSEVDIAGKYGAKLKWAGFSDSLMGMGGGYEIFITRFNATTGAVLGLDSLKTTVGKDNNATSMTSDRYGNFYVGGDFASSITVNGTTLSTAGGASDFFIAKYGTANCDTPLGDTTLKKLINQPPAFITEDIRVFPNPATDEINISGLMQNKSYHIYSVSGANIMNGNLHSGSNTISMRYLAAGIYILEMRGADGYRNVVRVVKE